MQAVASSGLSTVWRLLWGFVLCFILREIVVLKESALEGGVLFLIVGGLNRVYRGRAVPINLWKTGIPSETPTCPIGGREGDAKGQVAGISCGRRGLLLPLRISAEAVTCGPLCRGVSS